MDRKYFSVSFYVTGSGNEPVREWLKGLTMQERKIIGEDIKTVQFGWPIGMPLIKKIEPGLWEVRSRLPNKIARIIFTVIGQRIVLLHGFIKKSQKIMKQDLDLARIRLTNIQRSQ